MSAIVQNAEKIVYNEMFLSMTLVTCYKCGVPFGMPSRLQKYYENTTEGFYCPNGHRQAYVESTEIKLRQQLEKERLEKEHQRACRERSEKMYRKSETERKKVKTRLKNVKAKIAEGICPCCDQTFPDLHAHMSAAHPDFKDAHE
jgi:hypothetical protein